MLNFSLISAAAVSVFIGLLDSLGNFVLTGNFGLAKAAAGDLYPIFAPLERSDGLVAVFLAFVFVVTLGSNGPGRAPQDTDPASPVEKIEAVGAVMGVLLGRRLQGQIGDHATDPDGFSFGGDETVAQSKTPQATGVGRMPFGPTGGQSYSGRPYPFPVRGNHRSYGLIPFLLQEADDVFSQFNIELLTKITGVGPQPGGVFGFHAVAQPNLFDVGQNPGDDRQWLGGLLVPEGHAENLLGGKVKLANDFLISLK
jgi:hypothetical protein